MERKRFSAAVPKRTWAKKPIDVSFDLPSGVAISSCTVSAVEFVPPAYEGSDVSASLLVSTNATITGNVVTAVTQNGTDKMRYLVKFRAIFSDGSRKEKVVVLLVDDAADD